MFKRISLVTAVTLVLSGCQQEAPVSTLFTQMDLAESGIDFQNDLTYDKDFNVFTYRNFYNGGGVAVGDINNDGLVDLYFTANQKDNKLFLNKGNFKFEDITATAGVAGTQSWSTGVAMADVNGDGLLDIYVSNSGDIKGDSRANELFINNGDLTFSEEAAAWGVDDQGLSTHGVFFDYDKDGDLDLYVLNNSYRAIGSFNLEKSSREVRDPEGGDKLYRNDGTAFTDVSEMAGILGSEIGFGLGTTVGDVNGDGWLDIYISNDFFEKDYLYINNQDGTFREELELHLRHTSFASMGADMADINNDASPDIFVTDMLPEGVRRLNQTTTFENWDVYQGKLDWGYYHQFNRNMLHLNTAEGDFQEVGQLAGVEATDWSWGALIADLDNDGWRDIYISNGISHDLTDQDYINYISNEEVMRSIVTEEGVNYKELIDLMPSTRIPNYAYKNTGKGLAFENRAKQWGLSVPSHSNGAVYGDLDNDGDLDLIVNNTNQAPFLWRNNAEKIHPENHSLQLDMRREDGTIAIGAKVYAYANGAMFYAEHVPMKGFQSSVDPRIHLGLGAITTLDSLVIDWDGSQQTVWTDVSADSLYLVTQQPGRSATSKQKASGLLELATAFGDRQEDHFSQFNEERLLPQMTTTEGAKLAHGDINGDGYTDVYQCAAAGQSGQLFFGAANGQWRSSKNGPFGAHAEAEDTDAKFFDYDNDGDLDLYVASGSMTLPQGNRGLLDRIYKNDGRGNFSYDPQALPELGVRSSSIAIADFDGDGLQDVFVAARGVKGSYGMPTNSLYLKNYGNGVLRNERRITRGFQRIGMLTDCAAADIDRDGDMDLISVGDWSGVRIWINDGSAKFSEQTLERGFDHSQGLWNTMKLADVDGDGWTDIIAGNLGENCRLAASPEKPMALFVNDFDQNGFSDPILCSYFGDTLFPRVLRSNIISQLPYLKKENLKYKEYAGKSVFEVFDTLQLERSALLQVQTLKTTVFYNNEGTFTASPLPAEAQLAPVYAIEVADLNGDGHQDILLGGNLFEVQPEWGRYDASRGTVLLGTSAREFTPLTISQSGWNLEGQIRDIIAVDHGGKQQLLVSRLNGPIEAYTTSK